MKKGMALITILMMMMVLVMITTALVGLNSNTLFYSLNYNDKVAALMSAEEGVVYAIYNLQESSSWNPPSLEKSTAIGKFKIEFQNTGSNFYSVNNLTGFSDVPGYLATPVPANTVDLIVTGFSDTENVQRSIRVTIGRVNISEAGRCSGTAKVIASTLNITKESGGVRGTFHSNSNDGNAIVADGNTSVIANGGTISAVGGIHIPVYDSACGTVLKSYSDPKNIPDINIKSIVNSAAAKVPLSQRMTGGVYCVEPDGSGGYNLYFGGPSALGGTIVNPMPSGMSIEDGTLVFEKDFYFNGNTKFEFIIDAASGHSYGNAGIKLKETGFGSATTYPSVYIKESNATDESFICYGKIDGNGSIYTDGKSKFIMETNVAAGASGTALLSEKDIDIKLPASTAGTINLALTGVVMSHGNLNAAILDANDADNPTNVLGADNWPSDWVAQANYTTGSGHFSVNDSNPEKIMPMNPPPGKEGTTGWQMKVTRGIICTDSIKIEAKSAAGQIDVTGTGSDPRGLIYFYDPTDATWYGGPSTQRVWPSVLKKNGQGTYTDMSSTSFCSKYFGGDTTKLQAHIYNTLNKYFGGSEGAMDPNTPIYPPNVSIIGALIVADPLNLDGSGSSNPASGNININLTAFNGTRGNFNIIHSKKYEKLLASPSVNSQLQVKCWEEIH